MDKNLHITFKPENFTILIVDDEPRNIQVLGSLLRDTLYQVEYSTDAKGAFKLLEQVKIDLILLDVMMPEIDGFEASTIIRSKPEFNDIPIVFLTAKTDQESIIKGFEMGGQDYITKPFNERELLVRVRTQLELKESKEKLKNSNIWLEEQVKKRTKQLSLANSKLLDLDKTKSEFLNIISHEIRTPLSGIIGSVGMIKDQLLSDDLNDFLDILDHSSKRLEDFSYKALDISSIHLKGSELMRYKKICIEDLINHVKHQKADSLKEKDLTIAVHSSSDHFAPMDKDYVLKCFCSIIDNAIKFANPKTKIKIYVEERNSYHQITIMNQGAQFPPSYDINESGPFETNTHVDENPGLGLYLCKLIIDTHKGSIKNRDHKEGASIEICLPTYA